MQSFPKPLSSEEEAVYLKHYQNGDREAKNILVERNLRLVAHIVKKYTGSGRDMDELIAVGIVGLVKAVNTFRPDKGSRLGTYAARCIDNELLMMLRTERKLSREISLYEPIGTDKEGNEIAFIDVVEDTSEDIVDNMVQSEHIRRMYTFIEKVLTQREKDIIYMRYGLYGNKEKTQREIAEQMGISRSYVSRIEKKALSKLRQCF
ncbi:MAG TPA: RNA polymerase sporulation sigma factor SigK [Candidatus Onthocola gallistercoris]|uniref:RNA polymerase sporulation sigma factor SigK n=1 Tax=Candidatus Onthocola gallistercoris TaxID=2840876 RepID=A0A9D1HG21_9FIRM|nr:RNA polymerase sporulation sigma factor SigK [Candidatus Onthocola gallistercoris]